MDSILINYGVAITIKNYLFHDLQEIVHQGFNQLFDNSLTSFFVNCWNFASIGSEEPVFAF